MREIEINSWDEFQSKIKQIHDEFGEHETAGFTQRNRIVFRGQADSNWRLESTLERYSPSSWTVESYARLVLICAPQIESFTDRSWNLQPFSVVEDEIKNNSDMFMVHIPSYEFWVYLRHHDFPSPLLDWTSSSFIAAFFAFVEQNSAEEAAIFAYIEKPRGTKGGWAGSPEISVRGPYVRTHKRHFLQQSWYTVCTKYENNSHAFVCHEEVFDRGDPHQDVLIKIKIPRSERFKVLSYLNDVNINYFSLFQTEEALAKTLAFKEIENK